MSGHSQSKDENMFQHKGAGKQEVGQPSERGLSYKSHISANVWVLSSAKRSTEIGLRNGMESLTVKFGSSLKFKNKSVPLEAREPYLISWSSECRRQRKGTHYSRVDSPVPLLCWALLSHFVPKSTIADEGSLSASQGCVCWGTSRVPHKKQAKRVWTGLLQSGWHILTADWAAFNTMVQEICTWSYLLGAVKHLHRSNRIHN